jgi:hypothetical protein
MAHTTTTSVSVDLLLTAAPISQLGWARAECLLNDLSIIPKYNSGLALPGQQIIKNQDGVFLLPTEEENLLVTLFLINLCIMV